MSTIEEKTEQALARIFTHCDAVASGIKPTPSVEEGEEMARAFLGKMNGETLATGGRRCALTKLVSSQLKTDMDTPEISPPVASSAIVLPRPMSDAPLDGTHILAHNGDEYFPPVVVHFFGGSWYVSKWPDDCDNIYFPRKWWPLPQWQNVSDQ